MFRVASEIAEAAWSGRGVRVYAWPCGTVAWVMVGTSADALLLQKCPVQLLGTWARGARYADVLASIRAERTP